MEGMVSSSRVAFSIITISCCFFCFTSSLAIACPLSERKYLLDIKVAVVDENNTLSSWHGFNCCTWSGVGCKVHTGHVSQLDLSGCNLKGNISSSIFQLEHLEHLDLSYNLFNGNFTPPHYRRLKSLIFLDLSYAGYVNEFYESEFFVNLESLSNLVSLEYLSLDGVNISARKKWGEAVRGLSNLQQLSMSSCGLEGPIPKSLLNLPSLFHINLSSNYLSRQIPAWFVNVTAHLLSLNLSMNYDLGGDVSFIAQQKFWTLTSIDLSKTAVEGKIPSTIGNMSSLESLSLAYTNIEGEFPLSIVNLSKLVYLDLVETAVEGEIPSTIGSMSSLKSLALSYTNIEGEIPHSITNLSKLAYLDLFHNKLTGIIPPSLGSLSSLSFLDLGFNLLNTSFPSTVSDLVNLRTLYLDSINLGGSISLSLFDNLTRLELLDLSFNHLTVNVDSAWIPRFEKLNFLGLGSCSLDRIPSFLVNQYDLKHLDLSLNNITTIPSWLWKLPSLTYLNLSCNQLTGSLPSRIISRADLYLDLHNNSLEGALPVPVAGVKMMDLTMNQFSGSIPTDIGEHLQHTQFLSLSRNNLSGPIPDSICTSDLQFLDLSNNMVSSIIPPHLTRNCSLLRVLDLARNHLEGKIPAEWGNLKDIHTLKLAGNHLRGVIPSSIANCPSLQVLDLGKNILEGTIPHWIGKLSQLHVLMLRSNQFQGTIPPQVIGLPNLQILDLSDNHLSGPIPSNLTNLLAMVDASQNDPEYLEEDTSEIFTVKKVYTYNTAIPWKGGDFEFGKVLFILKYIDLSNNKLSGSIPLKMGHLKGLIALNLSRNHLTGKIPNTLGGMEQLESLDLSLNRLNGNIPLELQLLSYLEFLNLSYNMLDGKVPHGGQFLTFGESSYIGNPKLTGIPFTNTTVCNNSSGIDNCTSIDTGSETENSEAEMKWWVVGLGLSYGLAFSTVIGLLTFNNRVRKRVFNVYDAMILAFDLYIRGNR